MNKTKIGKSIVALSTIMSLLTIGGSKVSASIGGCEPLTEDEVKTVVGHELGHAVHYDMLFMTMAQLVPLVLYFIYEVILSIFLSLRSCIQLRPLYFLSLI